MGEEVKFDCCKLLEGQLPEDLKWETNIAATVKKAAEAPLFKKHNLSPFLKAFYHCCIEMILTKWKKSV